jgi:hypothetical protein
MELQSVEINSLIVQNNGVSTRMIFTNKEETHLYMVKGIVRGILQWPNSYMFS